MLPSATSTTPPCPSTVTRWPSPNMTRSGRSSSREGISTGRCAASSESSATRAERLADLTELNVATASTSVPPAVASEEIVTQSANVRLRRRPAQTRRRADSARQRAAGALEALLEPPQGLRVAPAHAHRHERRHQPEETARLGRHDQLDARARAGVGELPPAGGLHRAGTRLRRGSVPGEPRVGIKLRPFERALGLAARHLVAVGGAPRGLPV